MSAHLAQTRLAAPLRAACLAVLLWFTACQEPPVAVPSRTAVRVVRLSRQTIGTSTRYSGSVEPRERLDLAFKVGGKIGSVAQVGEGTRSRPLQEGDPVVRGQTLAAVEDQDFRTQVRAAASGVVMADAQVRGSEEALAHATTERERAKALYASGAMAKADMERAEAAWQAARSGLDAARGQRQGRVEQQELTKSTAGGAVLTSPIDGVIARRLVDVGSTVGPGTVAFTVIDTSVMRAVFGVPDTRIQSVHLGDRISIQVEALATRPLIGTVSKIHPVADPVLRSFAVEVELPNADGELRAGMVANAALGTETRADAMVVPLASIVRPAGASAGFAVWVLEAKTRAVALRVVELGDLVGNDVLVERGLAPGDQVVTDGAPFLHEGQVVDVLP